jgi:hypothetical protein
VTLGHLTQRIRAGFKRILRRWNEQCGSIWPEVKLLPPECVYRGLYVITSSRFKLLLLFFFIYLIIYFIKNINSNIKNIGGIYVITTSRFKLLSLFILL